MWGEFCEIYALNANKIDFKFTEEVVCPYCGYEFSDSWEFDNEEDIECENCENTFSMNRNVEVSYSTYKK